MSLKERGASLSFFCEEAKAGILKKNQKKLTKKKKGENLWKSGL